MTRHLAWLLLSTLLAGPALAQYGSLTIDEATLNELADRLGNFSEGDLYQPTVLLTHEIGIEDWDFYGYLECPTLPSEVSESLGLRGWGIPLARARTPQGSSRLIPVGDPISWQWWVLDPEFTIRSSGIEFSARVKYRIGGAWHEVSRKVATSVNFESGTQEIQVQVAAFEVPIGFEYRGTPNRITTVPVSRFYSFRIPLETQEMTLPMPTGPPKQLRLRPQVIKSYTTTGTLELRVEEMGFE